MLYLKEANLNDAEAEWAFLRDMPENENGVENRWHGCSRETFMTVALPRLLDYAKGENLREDHVAQTTFFLWADGEIVGLFKLRHWLNDALREGAGHIGYFVKPDCRGRGSPQAITTPRFLTCCCISLERRWAALGAPRRSHRY